MDCSKYQFVRALRPFSFSVALIACLSGIASAYGAGYSNWPLAAMVLLGGVLLQAGVNLINDYADLELLAEISDGEAALASRAIRSNFAAGLGCFLLATLIALYLIAQVGLPLLWISLIGLAGALTYTLNPVNYKQRGLGVLLVFWLMGVLMVSGSYLVVAGRLDMAVVWQSLPISLLTSLLLLSNELRDFEADRRDGIGTLAVRIGYRAASRLYRLMLLAVYLCAALLWQQGLISLFWPLLLTLPLLAGPLKLLSANEFGRKPLTPLTGRLLLLFGLIYCYCLL
ncbi:prenyltransferase [Marinobacterium arenosum]|uniref:prenyltransferase n=1 Tax=Marinobacterium arenosum TaxID=2862496 RepID=UPI001C98A267|nr:prenyltransferase [Marinobacterium arenosum]MBY4678592.1 prenyltransferase [Marinobacterium arenosum]